MRFTQIICFLFISALSLVWAKDSPVSVNEIILSSAKNNLKKSDFSELDGKVHAAVYIACQKSTTVTLEWVYEGKLCAAIPVKINTPTKSWRARTYVAARKGQWELRVVSQDQKLIAHKSFVVESISKNLKTPPTASTNKLNTVKEVLRALEPNNQKT